MSIDSCSGWLAVIAATLIVVEIGYGIRSRRRLHELRDSFTNLVMAAGGVSMGLVGRALAVPLTCFVYRYRLFELDVADMPWLWIPAVIVAEDFCFYWFHRCSHRVGVLWAAHEAHHSSEHYNLTTALRLSWTTPLTGIPFWLPLPVLGIPPAWIVAAHGLSLAYQFLLHTRVVDRLGPLEWFFNTPSHHRVHHASDTEYLDRNFGGIFILWDRAFGTFAAETRPPTFGLVETSRGHRPLDIAFGQWRKLLQQAGDAALPLRHRWAILFGRPGKATKGNEPLRDPSSARERSPDRCLHAPAPSSRFP